MSEWVSKRAPLGYDDVDDDDGVNEEKVFLFLFLLFFVWNVNKKKSKARRRRSERKTLKTIEWKLWKSQLNCFRFSRCEIRMKFFYCFFSREFNVQQHKVLEMQIYARLIHTKFMLCASIFIVINRRRIW
jgi:hypothetical protein